MKLTHLWAPARQYAAFKDESRTPTPQAFFDDTPQQQRHGAEKSAVDEKADPYLITFTDTPFADPREWSSWDKAKTVMQIVFIALQVTMASSISSSAVEGQMQEFGVVREVFLPFTASPLFRAPNSISSPKQFLSGRPTPDCRLLGRLCARRSPLCAFVRAHRPPSCLRLYIGYLQHIRDRCRPRPEHLDFDHLQSLLWYVHLMGNLFANLLKP